MTNQPPPNKAWLDEITTVTPLGQPKAPTTRSPSPPIVNERQFTPPPSSGLSPEPSPYISSPIELPPLTIVSDTAQRIAGHIQGLEPNLFKDLSKGKIPLSAQLDLHGWREGDGIMMLFNWLHEASHQGHRCILLIIGKGKGYGEQGDRGVFHSQIARLLAHHPRVMAFHTALPADGGAGALYIYLKKPI